MWPGNEITGGLPTSLRYVVEHGCTRPRKFGSFERPGLSAMAKLTVYEGRGRGRRPGDYSAILTCRGMLSVMHEQAPDEFHHRVLSRSFDRRLTRDIGANFSSRRRPRGCKGESETAGRARREVLLSMRVKRLFNCHCEMVPAVAICNK
jgi:hypothetical protein